MRSIPDLLLDELCAAPSRATATLAATADPGGKLLAMPEFVRRVGALALGLRSRRVMRGARVLLLLESPINFCIADVACAFAGAVSVPVDVATRPEELQSVLGHAEPAAAIVSSAQELDCLRRLPGAAASLKLVVSMDSPVAPSSRVDCWECRGAVEFRRALADVSLPELYRRLQELRGFVCPDDLATLIYPSGITGGPRGVMLTHRNVASNAVAMLAHWPLERGDVVLSFLPPHPFFSRVLALLYLAVGCRVHFTDEERGERDLRTVQPDIVATEPGYLEKLQERAWATARQRYPAAELEAALEAARSSELGRPLSPEASRRLAAARAGVFSVWPELFGGRLRFLALGGATLDVSWANFLQAAGIVALQGYGLTETGPIIALNSPGGNRAGTVGRPLPGVEVRLAPDGELLTRGPHVMRGFYRDPAGTQATIVDGWLHTGDLATIDAEGFITLLGRRNPPQGGGL